MAKQVIAPSSVAGAISKSQIACLIDQGCAPVYLDGVIPSPWPARRERRGASRQAHSFSGIALDFSSRFFISAVFEARQSRCHGRRAICSPGLHESGLRRYRSCEAFASEVLQLQLIRIKSSDEDLSVGLGGRCTGVFERRDRANAESARNRGDIAKPDCVAPAGRRRRRERTVVGKLPVNPFDAVIQLSVGDDASRSAEPRRRFSW